VVDHAGCDKQRFTDAWRSVHLRWLWLVINWCVALRAVNCTVHLRSCCSHSTNHSSIASYSSESRFLLTKPAFDAAIRGPCQNVWYGNTRIVWLPDGENFYRYVYSFQQNVRTWQTDRRTDGQTDTAWRQAHLAAKIRTLTVPTLNKWHASDTISKFKWLFNCLQIFWCVWLRVVDFIRILF